MESLLEQAPSLESLNLFSNQEPSQSDLDDLEKLLEESITLKKNNSKSTRNQYYRLKRENEAREEAAPDYFLLQQISVWVQYSCKKCQQKSPIYFDRYMRQLRLVGSGDKITWETVKKEYLVAGMTVEKTLIIKEPHSCSNCEKIRSDHAGFRLFSEVINETEKS